MPTVTPVVVATTSKQWTLHLKDVLQSLGVAVGAAVLPIIEQTVKSGSLDFNLHNIEVAGVSGFILWLGHRFISPSKTVITGAPEGSSTNVTIPAAGTSAATVATTK